MEWPFPAMGAIAQDHHGPVLDAVMAQVRALLVQRGAHPARTVVLVPYAQLMPWAQRFWAQQFPQGFAPRFETTRNWAGQLQGFEPAGDDFACDVARDTLTARALLERGVAAAHSCAAREGHLGGCSAVLAALKPPLAAHASPAFPTLDDGPASAASPRARRRCR